MSSGYGSAHRMPVQSAYEPPACVQNAMMTRDKKPFTYTPGGIDLSQIKSERMAKRLARNAQAEGVISAQQQNRPIQPQSPGSASPSASMGAAALGMPFQVLPPVQATPSITAGKNINGGNAPAPPPPPPSSNLLATSSLGSSFNSPNIARKSPTQQTQFEPPPIGFRPEIKIPPNPMAGLRKVPPPVERNNFWKDEYIKENSKSPMRDSGDDVINNNDYNAGNNGLQTRNSDQMNINDNTDGSKNPLAVSAPANTNQYQQSPSANVNNNAYAIYQQPQQEQHTSSIPSQPSTPQPYAMQPSSAPSKPQTTPKSEFRSVAAPQSPSVPVYTRYNDSPRSQLDNATPPQSPFKYTQQQQGPGANVSPLVQQQNTPSTASSGAAASPSQTIPWRGQRSNQQQISHTAYNNNAQQQQQSDNYNNTQSPKPTNVGSLYIAPLTPPTEPQAQHIVRQQMVQQQQQQQQQQRQSQQPPQQLRWLTSQPVAREQPEWARPEENGNVVPSTINRIKSPPPSSLTTNTMQHQQTVYSNGMHNFGSQSSQSSHASPGLRLQINTVPSAQFNNNIAPKERIIPIQLEQTPTHNPSQLSFNNQSTAANNAPGYIMRTPNQFVDQGYNSYAGQQSTTTQQQQQLMTPIGQQLNAPRMVMQQQQQASTPRTHIIPIAIEGNEGTRGPVSKTPVVIQNGNYNLVVHDCPLEAEIRFRKNRLSDQRTPPVQSKSFRILQKITDTIGEGNGNMKDSAATMRHRPDNYMDAEPQLQKPQFARQMSAQQARNSPTVEQMRRLQIAHEQDLNNVEQQHIPPSEQQVPEPKKYTGSAIPSRSFKILQAMTAPENAARYNSQHSKGLYDEQNYSRDLLTTRCQSLPPTPTMPMSSPICCDCDCHCHHHGPLLPSTNWRYIQILTHSLDSPENYVVPVCYAPCHGPYLTCYQPSANFPKPTSDLDLQNQVYFPCLPPPYSTCYNCHPSHPHISRPGSRNCRRARSVLPDITITRSEDVISEKHLQNCRETFEHDSVRTSNQTLECNSVKSQKDSFISTSVRKLPENDIAAGQKWYENASQTSSSKDDTALNNDNSKISNLLSIKSFKNILTYSSENQKPVIDSFEDDFTISDSISSAENDEEDEDEIAVEMDVNTEDSDETEVFLEEENLSVIYEEESDFERSSDYPKTVIGSNGSLQSIKLSDQIEDNDTDNQEESTSVTVRLPLKFSFRRSSNDENVATVEVGTSQVEEKKDSLCLDEMENCVQMISENNDCERTIYNNYNVSVTLPLKSSDNKNLLKNKSSPDKSPILRQSVDIDASAFISESPEPEDLNFFATLMATKKETQKIKEQSASYWGNSIEETLKSNEAELLETKEADEEIEDVWTSKTGDLPALKVLNRKENYSSVRSIMVNGTMKKTDEQKENIINTNNCEIIKLNEERPSNNMKTQTNTEIPYGCVEFYSQLPTDNPILRSRTELKEGESEEMECKEGSNLLEYITDSQKTVHRKTEMELTLQRTLEGRNSSEMTENIKLYNDMKCKIMDENPEYLSLYTDSKTPEDLREVDTDEEFDFWTEYEAKQHQSDKVGPSKAANFWALKEHEFFSEESRVMRNKMKYYKFPTFSKGSPHENRQTKECGRKEKEVQNKPLAHVTQDNQENNETVTPKENTDAKIMEEIDFWAEIERERKNKTQAITKELNTNQKSNNGNNDVSSKETESSQSTHVEPSLEINLSSNTSERENSKDINKTSVRERIAAFETCALSTSLDSSTCRSCIAQHSLPISNSIKQPALPRNSSIQRSESEIEEEDSGVTDINKSGTDTESEIFPELRKMTSYQRAATHSRLFKLLQEDMEIKDVYKESDSKPSRKKIVHNVSITRKQNPQALLDAETMAERRERLSLPSYNNNCSDTHNIVNDQMVVELVQSLLLKSDNSYLRQLPMEKIQAVAKRVLDEELNTLNDSLADTNPVVISNSFKRNRSACPKIGEGKIMGRQRYCGAIRYA
ncbi:uncharacterized protein ACN2A1_008779 isoform 3-T7 [Glossina fuscipes fuscipes]